MADASFPFPAIGSVHLENTIIQYRPVSTCETVSMSLKADDLRHHQGRARDMNVVGVVRDEVMWESLSTYLRVGEGGDKENGDPGRSFPHRWVRVEHP